MIDKWYQKDSYLCSVTIFHVYESLFSSVEQISQDPVKITPFGNIRLWTISLQKFTHLDLSLSPPFLFISILLLVVEKSLNWTSNPKTTYQILVLLTINNIIAAYFSMCCIRMEEDVCDEFKNIPIWCTFTTCIYYSYLNYDICSIWL